MIKPIGKRVLVEYVQMEKLTKSGIIIACKTETENAIAKVIEIGDVEIEKEELIYINKTNAIRLENCIKELYIVNEEDILAKVIN